ncbi:MAG: nuclease-related domain-containing protein [Deltaproteobacteria bacterium]
MRLGAGLRKRENRLFGGWTLPATIGEGVLKIFRKGKDAPPKKNAGEDIGDLLDGLPAGFFILHRFNFGNGVIDYILVGPKGLFVLNIQSHIGTIMVLGGKIFRNKRSLEMDRDLLSDVRKDCRILQELLSQRGITELKPVPLIVFLKAVVAEHGTISGVEVVQRNALPAFMNRRKNVITPREAEGIFEFLKIGEAGSPL